MEFIGLLDDHSQDACVRVIGIGSASSAADSAVETFESTGGAQVPAVPGRELLFQMVVGDGGTEVTAQGGDSFGLRMAIGTDDPEIAA